MHSQKYVIRNSKKNCHIIGSRIDRITDAQHNFFSTQEFKDQQLILSAAAGNVERTAQLLSDGANPNSTVLVTATDGASALVGGMYSQNPTLVKLLLDNNADANMPDSKGRYPAFAAVEAQFEEGFNLLLSKGANLHVQHPTAAILVNKAGKITFCKDTKAHIFEWNVRVSKEIRPATVYDMILLNPSCQFSQELKTSVQQMMEKAIQNGQITLTQRENEIRAQNNSVKKVSNQAQAVLPNNQNTKA